MYNYGRIILMDMKKKLKLEHVIIPAVLLAIALGVTTWVMLASYTSQKTQALAEVPDLREVAEAQILANLQNPETAQFSEPVTVVATGLVTVEGHVRAETAPDKVADLTYIVAFMRQGTEWVPVHVSINGQVFLNTLP